MIARSSITPSTVARIAGNIAAGFAKEFAETLRSDYINAEASIAKDCVRLARAIVAEVERT